MSSGSSRRVDETAIDEFISFDAIQSSLLELKESYYSPIGVLKDFRQPNFHNAVEFSIDFGGKLELGNFSLSKYPISFAKAPFVQNSFSYITDWKIWPDYDPRAIQVVDVQVQDKPLRIINYHGIWSKNKLDTQKTRQVSEKIITLSKEVQSPVIICGDFNLFPETKSIQLLNNHFTNLCEKFSIQSTRPSENEHAHRRNVIDYIFVSQDIQVMNFEVIESDVSDHFPLVLNFAINLE